MEQIYIDIGERLREMRVAAGMTQKQLGQAVGVSSSQISAIERATTRVALNTLEKLLAVFSYTLSLEFTPVRKGGVVIPPLVIVSGGLIV